MNNIILPIFRALTVESDLYPTGQQVEGDFVHTPAYINPHGLKFAAGFEIWGRDTDLQDIYTFPIDPRTLEISLDGGKNYTKLNKQDLKND